MSDDPFSNVTQEVVVKKTPTKKSKRDMFKTAGSGVTRQDTQKATGDNKGMHGQYKQANFRLRPELLDEIEQWADDLQCNKSQLKRYIAWLGLEAMRNGARPEFANSNRRDLIDY